MTLDLTGQKFGRLTAVRLHDRQNRHRRWLCKCECGEDAVVLVSSLRNGNTQSCGCLNADLARKRATKHGFTTNENPRGTPEYRTWASMKYRCLNPNNPAWKNYGGRGITICQRWLDGEGGLTGFECFLEDMGEKPSKDHTLERLENNVGYQPANCVWATRTEQSRNRRYNRIVQFKGESMPLSVAMQKAGVSKSTFYRRINQGMTEQEALSEQDTAI